MTLELVARLAVLLAAAVAAGVLYVRLVRPRPAVAGDPTTGAPATERSVPGAVNAALGAFVVVAGGSAIAWTGPGIGEDGAVAVLRLGGTVLLAAAGVLALMTLRGRSRLSPITTLVLAWIGAGMALVAPLVLVVATVVIAMLAVRVEDRPRA